MKRTIPIAAKAKLENQYMLLIIAAERPTPNKMPDVKRRTFSSSCLLRWNWSFVKTDFP